MGSVTVLVPPDVRIECDGDAIIGSFDLQGQKWSMPGAGAPTIHVTGTAFLGSVEVKVVNPNAPSWIKTLRTRVERGAGDLAWGALTRRSDRCARARTPSASDTD